MSDQHGYIYLTAEGRQKMQDELKKLKSIDRPRIVSEISRARDLGDLSENAEYHAAKERQVLVERKIAELAEKLMRAKVIDQSEVESDKAYLFSYVLVKDTRDGEEIRYQLVSPEEANIDEARISVESPIGKGLLSRSKGERVTIKVPAGELTYEIIDIERPS